MRVVSARARALVSVAKRLSRIMIGEYGVRPEWHSAKAQSFAPKRLTTPTRRPIQKRCGYVT